MCSLIRDFVFHYCLFHQLKAVISSTTLSKPTDIILITGSFYRVYIDRDVGVLLDQVPVRCPE